jgi:N-acetylmuramoyl-L-alanine amidase
MRWALWIIAFFLFGCQTRASVGDGHAERETAPGTPSGFELAKQLEQRWRQQPSQAALSAAIEAYEAAASGQQGCEARLRAVLLRAEAGMGLAAVRKLATQLRLTPECAQVAERVQAVLGPKPSTQPTDQEPVKLASQPESSSALEVTKVDRYGAKQSARIVVFLSRKADYQVGQLAATDTQGPRLYVDIAEAQYEGATAFEVGGIVERVRLGKQPYGLRIVLDLQQWVYKRVFYLPEPSRLVLDVSKHPPRAPSFRAGKGGRLRRVVLDPGHGGFDPGAIGMTGLEEKDVALDIAHRTAPLIARELGIDTLLTRDGDGYVALDERVAKANAFGADLFVSIHCNAAESSEPHGVMSFVLDASGDALAQRIAARENAASHAAVEDFSSTVSSMVDEATVRASVHFAKLLQRATVTSLTEDYAGVVDGGVRRAGFFVLAGARMPAVLFEASFISNPTEEERLDSARYRQKVADGLVNAIRAYGEGL